MRERKRHIRESPDILDDCPPGYGMYGEYSDIINSVGNVPGKKKIIMDGPPYELLGKKLEWAYRTLLNAECMPSHDSGI